MTTAHTPLKAVLFDMDGTLVNSLPVTMRAFHHGLKTLGETRTDAQIMAHFGLGEDQIFLNLLRDPERAQAAYLASAEFTREHMHEVQIHEGMREFLAELHARGILMGVVTGRSRPTTEIILKHHGLLSVTGSSNDPQALFKVLITHNEVTRGKPDPEGILKALKSLGVEPASAMYVGDTWMDIKAAHGAGVLAAAALWDELVDHAGMQECKPHLSAHAPAQLWTQLRARF